MVMNYSLSLDVQSVVYQYQVVQVKFLDYLLIFGIGPFPTMGIEGAALATTISNYASIPITLIYVFRSSKIPYKMRLINIIKFKPGIYKNVLIFGLPSGGEYLLWNIGCFVFLIPFRYSSLPFSLKIWMS